MLTERQRYLWRFHVRSLKKHLDPGVPVTVKSSPIKKLSGWSDGVIRSGRLHGVKVVVSSLQCWTCRIDTLIHEFAHVMDWSTWWDCPAKKDHGEHWGVWYAKAYRLVHEDTEDELLAKLGPPPVDPPESCPRSGLTPHS
jgi:hypothetical protein